MVRVNSITSKHIMSAFDVLRMQSSAGASSPASGAKRARNRYDDSSAGSADGDAPQRRRLNEDEDEEEGEDLFGDNMAA
jgi:hypothetical protein